MANRRCEWWALFKVTVTCSDCQATSSRLHSWTQNNKQQRRFSNSHNSSMRPRAGCRPVLDRRHLRLSNRWHLEVEVGVTRRCTPLSHHQLALPMDFRVVTPVCVPLVTTVVYCFVGAFCPQCPFSIVLQLPPVCLSDWLTDWLTKHPTPCSRYLLVKLRVLHIGLKFTAFYGTWWFVTIFTWTSHLSLLQARLMYSMPSHWWSQGSAVSIAIVLWDGRSGVRVPVEARDFSRLHNVRFSCRAHPVGTSGQGMQFTDVHQGWVWVELCLPTMCAFVRWTGRTPPF